MTLKPDEYEDVSVLLRCLKLNAEDLVKELERKKPNQLYRLQYVCSCNSVLGAEVGSSNSTSQ